MGCFSQVGEARRTRRKSGMGDPAVFQSVGRRRAREGFVFVIGKRFAARAHQVVSKRYYWSSVLGRIEEGWWSTSVYDYWSCVSWRSWGSVAGTAFLHRGWDSGLIMDQWVLETTTTAVMWMSAWTPSRIRRLCSVLHCCLPKIRPGFSVAAS